MYTHLLDKLMLTNGKFLFLLAQPLHRSKALEAISRHQRTLMKFLRTSLHLFQISRSLSPWPALTVTPTQPSQAVLNKECRLFCQLFLKILWSQTDIPSYQYRWRSYIWAPTSFIWISQLMTNEISCLHFSSKIRLLIFKLTSFSYVSFKVEESQSNVSLILFALSEDFSSCICLKCLTRLQPFDVGVLEWGARADRVKRIVAI